MMTSLLAMASSRGTNVRSTADSQEEAASAQDKRTVVLPRHRVVDAIEVGAMLGGDHVELVGDRELEVAPGVREELRQLGLLDGEAHGLHVDAREQRLGLADRFLLDAGDDLRDAAD